MAFYMNEAGAADFWAVVKKNISDARTDAVHAAHSAVGVGGGIDYSDRISVSARCKAGYWGTANAADVTETEFTFNLTGLPVNARLCFLGDLIYKTGSNGSNGSGKGNFEYYVFVNGKQVCCCRADSGKTINRGNSTIELKTNIAAIYGRALTKSDTLVVVEKITATSGYTNASEGVTSSGCELRGMVG